MPDPVDPRLRSLAEVIVRIGLNLQPGQPLLVTDPYDLQGAHPETEALTATLRATSASEVTVLPPDHAHLRTLLETDDLPAYEALIATHTRRLQKHLKHGGAFLFLTGSAPQLFAGLPADRLARFDAVKWHHLGPLIQRLVRGATQWTLVPAPTSDWAAAAGTNVPALWATVFQALRIDGSNGGGALGPDSALSGRKAPPTPNPSLAPWSTHLAALTLRRDALNTACHRRIRYHGPGTDLTLDLPRSHVWCTAQLITKSGVPFVANLPTEEIFTAPHKHSASGTVCVARPVTHNGNVIEGIEIELNAGRVTRARARSGEDFLHRLLATDPGASRIGEAAVIPFLEGPRPRGPGPVGDRPYSWQSACPHFHHTLLDENAAPHIALGAAYRFCSRAWWPLALNSSQLHLDLPLDADIELS